MRLKTIYDAVEGLAPFALSKEYCEKYGARDNSGIQLDCGGEIEGVLCSLDLSLAAIERAKAVGANCIVTHHPAIFDPLYSVTEEGEGKAVLACAKAGISVLSAHLNLDGAKDGIDDSLMLGLGGGEAEQVMHPLTGGGYGKLFSKKPQDFSSFLKETEKQFHTNKIVAYGGGEVKKIASFCGAGMDGDSVAFALEKGADTFVSSDGKHHLIAELVNRGVKVVLLPHYAAELYGFARFYEKLKNKLKGTDVRTALFADETFL